VVNVVTAAAIWPEVEEKEFFAPSSFSFPDLAEHIQPAAKKIFINL
jgi:hypothetical protein